MKNKSKYYVRPDGIHESIRTINGKRVAFRGKSDREVDKKILEYKQELKNGRKFSVIADEWEREHESGVSESTRRVYSYAVKRLKEEFKGLASEVRPLDVQRYIAAFEKQGRSANSVQIELAVCKMIFAHAVISGDIDVSPAVEIKKSRGLPTKKREALTDERFANMIREAEKYLGYPYVWGGSSPSTSFDCSGFVSWVINHCGNGWNVGRLTASGLMNHCSIIRPSEAKPGDLIFFQGTYNTSGASHVGIYVGNGMMIHCGNPISYASINTSYWQQHFYCYGRIPD